MKHISEIIKDTEFYKAYKKKKKEEKTTIEQ